MAGINLSLERALQGDGWWYSIKDRLWSRMWDDQMQYGEIRDGKFERIYPKVPKPVSVPIEPPAGVEPTMKDPCDPGNWRDSDDAMGDLGRAEAEEDRLNEQQYAELTMADVGDASQGDPYPEVKADTRDPMLEWMIKNEQEHKEKEELEMRKAYLESIRDQFAMRALTPLVMSYDPKSAAIRAYHYADAMMIARELNK